jgi:hypothetical protein
MTPAQHLTHAVRDYLALRGWVTFKCGAGMVKSAGRMVCFGTAGAPDLVAIRGDRYLLLEIKAGKDRMSAAQKAFKDSIEATGGVYHVIRSLDQIVEMMEGEA